MKLLRSLRIRLLLMFMFVVIVTLATVAFIQQQATTSAFQNYTKNAKEIYPVRKDVLPIIDNILATYQSGNLTGLKAQMAEVAMENEVRVILVDSNKRIVYDSNEFTPKTDKNASNAPYASGTSITQQTPALLSASALPVILISTNVASSRLASPPLPSDTTSKTLSQDFLNTITHSFWLVIVLAWLLALLLTLALSNHILKPVRELTRIANRMEKGDLSQRIRIHTKDEMGMLAHAFNTMADSLSRSEQLRRNLVSNAITHTPPGGEITIHARAINGEVLVSLDDTGEGIEEQHLPYIFERFYRTDASRSRATGGTGLGLAIVKQVVESHGGQVEAQSSLGCGTSFTFSLPMACR